MGAVCFFKGNNNLKARLSEQDKKIEELKKINEQLQSYFQRFQDNEFNILLKQTIDTTNDITNLRAAFDAKFSRIEQTVVKIHSDIKKSFHEHVELGNDNLGSPINKRNENEKEEKSQNSIVKIKSVKENDDKGNDKSLSLNFERERQTSTNARNVEATHLNKEIGVSKANELIIPPRKEENKSLLTLNEIQMQIDLANTNPNLNNDSKMPLPDLKDTNTHLKSLLEDEQINKIYTGVVNKMFKNLKNTG